MRAELKRLPEERQKRRREIDAQVTRSQEQTKNVREVRIKIKDVEELTTRDRQRIRKLENEAAASRQDVAMLAAYQHEIKTLKREISTADEQGLEFVSKVEVMEAELAKTKAAVEEAEKLFAEFNGNVEREIAEAQKKLDALLTRRKERMSASIAPESLALYERLLTAREGTALAELDGRICQACFMEVPTNLYVRVARATSLTQCPSCDRILFQRET